MLKTILFVLFAQRLVLVWGGIDPDQLRMYPDCGKVSFNRCDLDPGPSGSARVAGGRTGIRAIPWLVVIYRKDVLRIQKPGKPSKLVVDQSICSGSLITMNAVLTAGHCICNPTKDQPHIGEMMATKCYDDPSKNQIDRNRLITMHFDTVSNNQGIRVPANEGFIHMLRGKLPRSKGVRSYYIYEKLCNLS